MKNLNYIDRSLEYYKLKYDGSHRFYMKAIRPDHNFTSLQIADVMKQDKTAIIYLLKPERIYHENLMIDFEESKIVDSLARLDFERVIVVDSCENPMFEHIIEDKADYYL